MHGNTTCFNNHMHVWLEPATTCATQHAWNVHTTTLQTPPCNNNAVELLPSVYTMKCNVKNDNRHEDNICQLSKVATLAVQGTRAHDNLLMQTNTPVIRSCTTSTTCPLST